MKTLKYMSLIAALTAIFTLGMTACGSDDNDDTPAPVVTLTEANLEGTEVCTQADVVAKGRTKTILIQIFDAAGKTQKVACPVSDSKYIDKLNIDGFHVHVDVAEKNVAEGDLLKLTVTDANGRSTTAQQAITAEEEEEDEEEHEHHHD